jgi:SLT domain-containing protein
MNYPQIDHALTFLTKPGDTITLQVPYHNDVYLAMRYIVQTMGKPTKQYRNGTMGYPNGTIRFESVGSNDLAGIGQDCVFFIDRDHDRSYLEWLEA